MTRIVRGDDVEVELGAGTFTFRWPALGITLGPCSARADVVTNGEARELSSTDHGGAWNIEPRSAYGRPGAMAEWRPAAGGLRVSVHVPTGAGSVVVRADHTASQAGFIDRITPCEGPTDLRVQRRLVDGYDSWAYSGVRAGEPGASFWNTALVDGDGRTLAAQALRADRSCTRLGWDGPELTVDQGAPPPQDHVPGTWGYLTPAPPGLGLPLDAGETFSGEPVAISAGVDAHEVVEDLAALAGTTLSARRWTGRPMHGWESWYHYGLFVSAEDVLTNARLLRDRFDRHPDFDLLQIDDGWQVTYGAWTPNDRFPSDLGGIVEELRALGCRPGLWIAPFRVQPGAPGVAEDHPDWCLRPPDAPPESHDDEPWLEPAHGKWALDASHPDACAWIRDLGARVRAWGFEMVKVDFCYLGAVAGRRHDPRVTGIEALQRGLAALVEGLGEDIYVLGCGMPMLPAVGHCHANRVGHDLAMPRVLQELGHPVDADTEGGWTGMRGVQVQARNVAARWSQHGRWYDADPEVVMAWGADGIDPAGYSTEAARVMATLALVTGGPFLLADDLAAVAPVERAVLEHAGLLALVDAATPDASTRFRPVDLFEHADAPEVLEHAYSVGDGIPTRWVAERGDLRMHAFFNWTDRDAPHPVPAELVGTSELWTAAPVAAEFVVPPSAVRVLVERATS